MKRVKIYQNENGGTEVECGGVRLDHVYGVTFQMSVSEVPTFTIETLNEPDIDIMAKAEIDFSPKSVAEAARIICHEAKTDRTFMDAFVSSIESVLRESEKIGQCADGAAREIAERILDL